MRHFLRLAFAVTPLAGRMQTPTTRGLLVPTTGLAQGFTAGGPRACRTAVDMAPVTPATDRHRASAASTVEKTGGSLHRQYLPMRDRLDPGTAKRDTLRQAVPGTVGCGTGRTVVV